MSTTTTELARPTTTTTIVRTAIAAGLGAGALAAFAVYADSTASAGQRAVVPFELAIIAAVTAFVFWWVVPRGCAAVAEHRSTAGRWALTPAVLAFFMVPTIFWTGLPIVLGAAAVVIGAQARTEAGSTKPARAALGVAVIAMVAEVVITVVATFVHP